MRRLLFALLCVVGLLIGPHLAVLRAAVTFDAASLADFSISETHTHEHTVGSGSDRYLVRRRYSCLTSRRHSVTMLTISWDRHPAITVAAWGCAWGGVARRVAFTARRRPAPQGVGAPRVWNLSPHPGRDHAAGPGRRVCETTPHGRSRTR